MPTPTAYEYDVFLSHSSKDKAIVRPLAERLRADGVRVWFDEWEILVGDSIPAKIEEGLEHSRVLVLCMSAHAFDSDWTTLEGQTFLFRDPQNEERRFVPLRLDEVPITGALAQFVYLDWPGEDSYERLLQIVSSPLNRLFPTSNKQLSNDEHSPVVTRRIFSIAHIGLVQSVAFSSDGRYVLSGAEDYSLRLWDTNNGQCLRTFEGHLGSICSVVFSNDGRYAMSGADDCTLRRWDIETGQCINIFKGHTKAVNSIASSADDLQVVSGADDLTLRVWDTKSGTCLRVFNGHTDSVRSVAFSTDGRHVLSGADDATLRLWDTTSGECLFVFKGHIGSVTSVTLSADGRRALSGATDEFLRLWDTETGTCLHTFEGHTDWVRRVAFSADGHRAISGADDATIRLWDIDSGQCLHIFKGHSSTVTGVGFSPNGRHIFSASTSEVKLRYTKSGRHFRYFLLTVHISTCMTLSADSRYALSGSQDCTLQLWDAKSSRWLRTFEGHAALITDVAFSNDGNYVLSGAADGTVRLWDIRSGDCLHILTGHADIITSVAISTDGQRILSGSTDCTLRLWDANSGECLRIFKGHTGSVASVALSTDGSRAISSSDDATLRSWDTDSGQCLQIYKGHIGSVISLALSPDGRRILSGAGDRTLRLWDTESGQCLLIFEGHTDWVRSLAFSTDGRLAIAGDGGFSSTIRLWDMESAQCIYKHTSYSSSINNVGFSANSHHAFSCTADGTMHIWELDLRGSSSAVQSSPLLENWTQYTNAKVLLVGESGVGKTGLSNYLALGIKDEERNTSTDGAWATHWPLPQETTPDGIKREILLWDFAGQVDYRLVHQLFMDDTAVAVLVFNPQAENPFDALAHWNHDLTKATRKPFSKLLVAGRTDRGGLVVSDDSMRQFMREHQFPQPLYLTSAKTGAGCDALRDAIVAAVDWQQYPITSSPVLYHRLKEEILKLRDQGWVLLRLAELKQRLELILEDEPFELAELETVVRLLAGPGHIRALDFGGFLLLRPEILSRYAAALVRQVRRHPDEMGCISEDDLLQGNLDYQDFERLPPEEESVVLRALCELLINRAWCYKQEEGPMLTFPSYFRRERPEQVAHPHVLVTYRFCGPIDEIYATLVVRLHHTKAFDTDQLWRFAADFKTQTDQQLGFRLHREPEGRARLEVYFAPEVGEDTRVVFLRYIHEHLHQYGKEVQRLRQFVCLNRKCKAHQQPIPQATIDQAIEDKAAKVFCPRCGKSIPLQDVIEKRFNTPEVKEQVRQLQAESQHEIDNESREQILLGHAFAIAGEAGQIFRPTPNADWGIDGEIEFKDDQGHASGQRLYLQLKSGDSYLTTRQRDKAEVFQIKNARWATYWQQHAYPVMLVIRTSNGEIRWMEITSYLQRESRNGTVPVTQIVFEGERFDMMSVRRWRDKVLKE